jgi:hypothetical protein
MSIEITKFSSLITFLLVWRFLLMRHWRASIKGVMFNIKSLKISLIQLNYRGFYQTPISQQQIKNLLIPTFKI